MEDDPSLQAEEVPEGINWALRGAQCWGLLVTGEQLGAAGIVWPSFLPAPIQRETLDTCLCYEQIRFRHLIA